MPKQKQKKLAIVVPCYNEGPRIYRSLKSLSRNIKKHTSVRSYQIIAVNDGSADNTLAELERAKKEIRQLKIIHYDRNQGKGYAVKKGIQKANADYVAYIDADGEIPYQQIGTYYQFAKHGAFDIVIGSKTHPLSNTKFSFFRKIISLGYRMINQTLFRLNVNDTQVGIKLFTQTAAQKIFPLLQTKGYAFDVELLSLAEHAGFQIFEAPVKIVHAQDRSSIGIASIARILIDTIKIKLKVHKTLSHLKKEHETQLQIPMPFSIQPIGT